MTLDLEQVKAALPAYEVGDELGRGGYGVVLEGRHRQLRRSVAIKQLPRAFGADPQVRARFQAEARLLAGLDHPHIVPIYDFVEKDGLCLLIMERLTAGTLRDRAWQQALSPQQAVALTLATNAALHCAHTQGILHRDVKPENVMFGATGVLKVTDFGIAKMLGGTDTFVTRAGEVLGTPAYMAPEQAQAKELTVATDVYAVGVMTYELLARRLPFDDDGDPFALLYRHVHEAPIPLSDVTAEVPAGLARAVMAALATNPADRYQSAEAFSLALAEAATVAWGPGWLGGCGVPVMAAGPIVAVTERPATPSSVSPNPTLAAPVAPPPEPRPERIPRRASPHPVHASVPAAPRTKLVGRDHELGLLLAGLDAAAGGAGRVALVGGEPGIGKSRLAQELSQRAARWRVQVAWGRCHDGDAAPAYWPWAQIMRTLLYELDESELRTSLRVGAAELAQIVPEIKEMFAGELDPLPLLEPEAARARLYDTVVRYVVRVSMARPVLLVIDDLQWADIPSLQLLQLLASQVAQASILVVCNYREREAEGSEAVLSTLAALARVPGVIRVRLGGLTDAEVGQLLADAAGTDPGDGVAEAIRSRTEGNPFFVSELAQLLADQRQLGAGAGDVVRREVPEGVRDVIRLRLGRLPDDAVALLGVAAVIGRDFELQLLAAVADVDEDTALDLVEAALLAGLVLEDTRVIGRYRFSHALVREAVYEGLSSLRRLRLHRRAGQELVTRRGADDSRTLEIASHLYAGSSAGGAEEAVDWMVRAADRATAGLAFEQAETLLRRAIELLGRMRAGPEVTERELRAQVQLGTLLFMTRGYSEQDVGEAWARARELCRAVPGAAELLPTLWGLWAYRCVRAEFPAAEDLAAELISHGGGAGRELIDVVGHETLGITRWHQGRLPEARAHLETGADLCDRLPDELFRGVLLEKHPGVACRCFGGIALWLMGEESRAIEVLDGGVALGRRLAHPFTIVFALFFDATLRLLLADREGAIARADEAIALAGDHGFRQFGAMARIVRGCARDDLDEMEAGLAVFLETGSRMLQHFFIGLMADVQRRRGQLDEALATVERALAEGAAVGERFWETELYRLKGELLVVADPPRPAEAESCFRRATTVAQEQGARALELRVVARSPVPAEG